MRRYAPPIVISILSRSCDAGDPMKFESARDGTVYRVPTYEFMSAYALVRCISIDASTIYVFQANHASSRMLAVVLYVAAMLLY